MTPDVYEAVMERDGGCRARYLDPKAGPCEGRLTLDHVQDGYGRMGRRAPSDPAHLVVLCLRHGVQGWELSHKPLLREYLRACDSNT